MPHVALHKISISSLCILFALGIFIAPSVAQESGMVFQESPLRGQQNYVIEEAPDSEWPTEEQPAVLVSKE